MTTPRLRPLTNDQWGFESNCFVCEPRNDSGLRIPFHHDTVDDVVVAEFELDGRFSGAPTFVHGGVALAVLDEAMAWATIAIAGRFAVTVETTTRFERPVKVGRQYRVLARIDRAEGTTLHTTAEIVRPDGKRCAAAEASFHALDLQQATDATGATLSDAAAGYSTGDRDPAALHGTAGAPPVTRDAP